jgi:hypothetical protein
MVHRAYEMHVEDERHRLLRAARMILCENGSRHKVFRDLSPRPVYVYVGDLG